MLVCAVLKLKLNRGGSTLCSAGYGPGPGGHWAGASAVRKMARSMVIVPAVPHPTSTTMGTEVHRVHGMWITTAGACGHGRTSPHSWMSIGG